MWECRQRACVEKYLHNFAREITTAQVLPELREFSLQLTSKYVLKAPQLVAGPNFRQGRCTCRRTIISEPREPVTAIISTTKIEESEVFVLARLTGVLRRTISIVNSVESSAAASTAVFSKYSN